MAEFEVYPSAEQVVGLVGGESVAAQAVEHLAAAAHAPLQAQMAAVVADSVAAVQAVPALQEPRLPHAATPAPHSALQ